MRVQCARTQGCVVWFVACARFPRSCTGTYVSHCGKTTAKQNARQAHIVRSQTFSCYIDELGIDCRSGSDGQFQLVIRRYLCLSFIPFYLALFHTNYFLSAVSCCFAFLLRCKALIFCCKTLLCLLLVKSRIELGVGRPSALFCKVCCATVRM